MAPGEVNAAGTHPGGATHKSTRLAAVAAAAFLGLSACGAGVPNGVDPSERNLQPGSVADCPVPDTPDAVPHISASSTGPVSGSGVGHPRGPVTATATPAPVDTVPGYPGTVLPSPAPVEAGDARITAGLDQSVALHVGRTLQVTFSPYDAVVVPGTPDARVLRSDGRSCEADGTAVFMFTALKPGTVVFVFDIGPRCLHAPTPCMPGERDFPLRVDVLA